MPTSLDLTYETTLPVFWPQFASQLNGGFDFLVLQYRLRELMAFEPFPHLGKRFSSPRVIKQHRFQEKKAWQKLLRAGLWSFNALIAATAAAN